MSTTLKFDYGEMSEIDHGLYLSSIDSAFEHDKLREYSIKCVLSILSNKPPFKQLEDIEYHFIELDDEENQDLLVLLDHTYEIISKFINNNQNILVHCALGVSRSSAAVIAYVMRSKHISFSDAIEFVKLRRIIISPNLGFRKQLALYEITNCDLNLKNIWIKRYVFARLVKTFCDSAIETKNDQQTMNYKNYLKIFQNYFYQKKNTANGGETCSFYKCKSCRLNLFDKNDIIHQNDNGSLFTSLLSWIAGDMNKYFDLTEKSGKINCPGCHAKLGRFNWCQPFEFRSYSYTVLYENTSWTNEIVLPLVFSITHSKLDLVDL